MSVTTRKQKMAEAAFSAVRQRKNRGAEYDSFAKSFPALIQTAGLCQAVAFAQAKGKGEQGSPKAPLQVLEDVCSALTAASPDLSGRFDSSDKFAEGARSAPVTEYLRLTRIALEAATWVKRYVEALEA